MQYDTEQLEAIKSAVNSERFLITGGAGTGKTTIIEAIIKECYNKVALLAPTGKAAARLKEVTGYNASTIHRFLKYDGKRFNRESFSGTVIVDESSMIDNELLYELIELNPRQIILVGDASQLPPVGPGQPFHDLLNIMDNKISLKNCYRAQGAIHKASQKIRKGQSPNTNEKSGGESFKLLNTGDIVPTFEKLEKWFKAKDIYDPNKDIVLSCVNGSKEECDGGVESLNRLLIKCFNPHGPGEEWRRFDRVINIQNYGPDDWWNGDIGTIVDIDINGNLYVMPDRTTRGMICLDSVMKKSLRHGYCLTVHKSQGSQFRRVIFVCFKRHFKIMDRKLIYTAVTRAMEGCVVCGEVQAFFIGLNQVNNRTTVLQKLKDGEYGAL